MPAPQKATKAVVINFLSGTAANAIASLLLQNDPGMILTCISSHPSHDSAYRGGWILR